MKDYRSYSWWLETAGDNLTPRPALDGAVDADVAILGAGYTGLWTAWYLLERDPSLKVVIVEQEIAGFGASGRNGGWVTPGYPVTWPMLERRYGFDAARATALAMEGAVDEIDRVAQAENMAIDWHRGGTLRVARGTGQLPAIESARKTYEHFGLADRIRILDEHEVAEMIQMSDALAAVYSTTAATIHPGKLVRQLARAVERRGATIYERTPVTGWTSGAYPALHTENGHVRARTLVLAGESYLSQLKQVGRQLIPIYSLIVLTEPLPASVWQELGWESRFNVATNRLTVDYLSKTVDGRIVFGGRGAPYRLGSRMSDAQDRHAPTHQMLRDSALEYFPALRQHNVRFTHAWGGPLGVPRDYMPTMAYDKAENVATARGYTGQGVATANLSGRTLADLILGVESDITRLPHVNHHSPDWEPEPMRFAGVRYVQRGFGAIDAQTQASGIPPTGKSLPERLNSH